MAKVTNLTDISDLDVTFDEIRTFYDENLHPDRLDLDDAAVYKNVYHKGRWAGVFQCVAAGTPILMADGSIKSIEDIEIDDVVLSHDEETCEEREGFVDGTTFLGHRECIELEFEDGSTLVLTGDHWVMTDAGTWVQASDLQEGNAVMTGG